VLISTWKQVTGKILEIYRIHGKVSYENPMVSKVGFRLLAVQKNIIHKIHEFPLKQILLKRQWGFVVCDDMLKALQHMALSL
jgi:hypothetical protein